MDEQGVVWAAGFFDGEGCINIAVYKTRNVTLRVIVTNTCRGAVDRLAALFPGAVRRFTVRPNQRQPVWEWSCSGAHAAAFCEAVLPYSVVKAPQHRLALEFFRQPWRRQTWGRGGRSVYRTQEQIDRDLEIAGQMRKLKLLA